MEGKMAVHGLADNRLSEAQGRALLELASRTLAEKLGLQLPGSAEVALLHEDPKLQQHSGTFVTLKLNGQLRGCIGNLLGTGPLLEGIRRNAINAAFHDHRFAPLTAEEFKHLSLEISILTTPQPLLYNGQQDLINRLHAGTDGVILRQGMASATFLPQVWEQLPRPEDFLAFLCKKAGLAGDAWQKEQLEIEIYQVQHFP